MSGSRYISEHSLEAALASRWRSFMERAAADSSACCMGGATDAPAVTADMKGPLRRRLLLLLLLPAAALAASSCNAASSCRWTTTSAYLRMDGCVNGRDYTLQEWRYETSCNISR